MDERNVGDLGEDTLALWCSQVGIITTKSHRDRKGWDYLLEFPDERESLAEKSPLLDRTPAPIKCWIQVKASDKRPRSWPVKLDNWERFVKDALPAFFLVMEFDGQPSCQRAYLVHVDRSQIERVLKELRRISLNKSLKKHEVKLRFAYDETNALSSLDGRGLNQAIRHHVGNDLASYSKEKLETVSTVGYEEGGWYFNFTTTIPEDASSPQEYFVDFALGLVPFLETTRHEVRDARFDLMAVEPTTIVETLGRVEITDRKSKGMSHVRFSNPRATKELLLQMETYVPDGLGPIIGEEYFKIRLAAPFLDFVIWPHQPQKSRLTLHTPEPDTEYELHDLQHAAELVQFLQKASAQNERVFFEIFFEGTNLARGNIDSTAVIGQDVIGLADVISEVWRICQYHKVHNLVRLKLTELYNQYGKLHFISLVLGPEPVQMKLGFWSDPSLQVNIEPIVVPYAVDLLIGQYRIVMAVAIVGVPIPTGNTSDTGIQVELQTQDVRLVQTNLRFRFSEDPLQLEQLIEDVANEYSETHQVVIIR